MNYSYEEQAAFALIEVTVKQFCDTWHDNSIKHYQVDNNRRYLINNLKNMLALIEQADNVIT
jgi:hypothetical protein